MRVHRLRFDIWVCLALSVLIAMGSAKIVNLMTPKAYENYVEEHTVEDGEIGGIADESVFRAQSVEDLLSHDTFTVVSPGIEYMNRGAGYFGNYYLYALTLPSGERVAARYNMDSVQKENGDDSDLYSGDKILPVGQVVYEDLTESKYFLEQIEHSEPLSRTDFYVDMCGNGGKMSQETYSETPVMLAQILAVVICFPLLHMLGSKLGIFPRFFSFKKQEAGKWE
ncbi:MAG: hypothetical protein HDQ99_10375 [Lachnospiraceae bacterium]|nr:hypothetical protein [Lachnospiraceae bacterium]